MDLASITTAYEGLKLGKNILNSLLDIKVESEAKERVNEVMSKLGEAQDTLFSMREELFRLQTDNENYRKQIEKSDNWENKLSQYELVTTSGGAVVYKFKENPEHYICPSCVSKHMVEILQDNRTISGKYRCVGCKSEFPIKPQETVNINPSPGGFY